MKKLKDKRVLVTGGAGFIGSHIVDRLLSLGTEVAVLDNLSTGKLKNIEHNLKRIKFIQEDLTDNAALEEALDGVEYVSHQAALLSVPESVENPFKYHKVNVGGTLELFIKAEKKGIKRIVFASSSAVYGERVNFPEKETDLPCPISPYAATKLNVEHYANVFSKLHDLEIVSLRYFNVFGPRQSLKNKYAMVVPKFITCLLKGESPPIYGDGNQERDFTYIDNVVQANILALTSQAAGGEVVNVASGDPRSVNGLLDAIRKITKKNIDPVYLDQRDGDVKKTYADTEKAKNVLGLEPKVNFYEGLEKTIRWFEENEREKTLG